MPPKKAPTEKSLFAEPEAKIAEMIEKGESSTKEASQSVQALRSQFSNFGMSFARHKMGTDSTLREHRGLITKHSEDIEQTTRELEEAFDTLWPKITEFEKSLRNSGETSKKSETQIKKNAEAVSELGSKVLDLAGLIERKHKSALTRINQVGKVQVKVDEEESKEFKKELKRLEKLVKEVGKYEYGSQLNVLLGGVPIGFTGQLNFKSGFTVTQTGQGIDIVATGGSFSVQVPVGTVDGSNKTFVFATAPSVISLDNGNFMNKVSSDGTVNWTGTTTVVLNQAPNFNIYGF